jgi:hypothetical protein
MRRLFRRRRWRNSARSQRVFPFEEHARRREFLFKQISLGLTLLVLAAIVTGTSRGRDAGIFVVSAARSAFRWSVGLEPDRAGVDARWRRQRERSIEATRATYQKFYDHDAAPQLRRVLDEAGMAPRDALFRWANFDRTVVLASRVFKAEDAGRSYAMLPNVRSFWMRRHALPDGLSSFFFVPDTPGVRLAMEDAREGILPESMQTTNSWGCRGAEPNVHAEIRGLVVGDSFMQGIFVPDDQTPPACLERVLRSRWKRDVSLLNTGHIGYSPEQYYYTLLEYFERFQPHFVVVSICANDFGNAVEVIEHGKGDWDEGTYWLEELERFTRVRNVPCFLVPVPFEFQVRGKRMAGNYPGRVSNDAWHRGIYYIDPIEAFVDEHLRLMKAGETANHRPLPSPLYNGNLNDGHFSPLGCQLWAEVVARRVDLLFEPPPRPK